MRRLYVVMAWLAGAAFVVGVVKAILFLTQAINAFSPGNGISQSDGLIGVFFKSLDAGRVDDFLSISSLLIGGVMVTAVIVAWADHRRGWLIALLAVMVLTVVWPTSIQMLIGAVVPTTPPPYPTTISLFAQGGAYSLFLVPLIPVVMALILALTRRNGADASGAQGIAMQRR